MKILSEFVCHKLADGHEFYTRWLPQPLIAALPNFEELWQMHPLDFHEIKIHGRLVPTPRWQQAYGQDYHYTGRVNVAMPVPVAFIPLLQWAKEKIDERLNGILVNWYDGSLGHYIGRHRDSVVNMVQGAPIVTISLGEERLFRLRPWPSSRGKQRVDFEAKNDAVFVIPFETNLCWTHEVPAAKKWNGRRISVTLRAFNERTAAH